jgi:hypothetical protein
MIKLENKKGSLINKWLQKNKIMKRIRETESYQAEKLQIKHQEFSNVLNHYYQSNEEISLRSINTNITSMCYNIQV